VRSRSVPPRVVQPAQGHNVDYRRPPNQQPSTPGPAPTVTRRLIEHFVKVAPRPPRDTSRLDLLTAREREVLVLITRGLSNGEIAETLVLSEGTVKGHVNRILTRLDLRDRVQAVILGYRTGLVPIDS
jgi:DNA-binding NarL/FixJ family response regulator